MANSCNFKTSEASTKSWFRTKGLIDKYLNILDLPNFRKANTKWSKHANDTYGVEGRLFLEENDGKKAVPNKEMFETIDIKKGVFYAEGDTPSNIEVQDKIFEFISQMGISIQSLNEYKEDYKRRTGKDLSDDIKGIADSFRNIIALDDTKYLHEEVGHMATIFYKDQSAVKKAMDLVDQVDLYMDVKNSYEELYKEGTKSAEELETKIKLEVLGKLVGNALSDPVGTKKETKSRLFRLLERIFNYFKDLFSNNKTQSKNLNDYVNKIADDILKANSNAFDNTKLGSNLFAVETKELDDLTSKMQDIVISSQQRLYGLRQRQSKNSKPSQRLKRNISKIREQLQLNNAVLGLAKFLKFLKEDTADVKQYMQEVGNGTKEITSLALDNLSEYIAYYKPHLQELEIILENDFGLTKMRWDILKDVISDEIKSFREIENFLKKYNLKLSQDWIKENNKEVDFDESELEQVNHDSSSALFWFGSLKNADDNILRIIQNQVVNVKNKVFRNTVSFGSEIIKYAEELGLTGKSFDWIAEKKDGMPTGRFMSKHKLTEWAEARNKFHKELHEKYGFDEDPTIRYFQKQQLKYGKKNQAKLKRYKTEVAKWYAANTIVKDNWNDIMEQRKAELSEEQFKEWQDENMPLRDPVFPERGHYFAGELTEPSDGRISNVKKSGRNYKTQTVDWTNPDYYNLSPNQLEFLNYIKNRKGTIDAGLPKNTDVNLLPQINDSLVDILKLKKPKLFNQLKLAAKREFVTDQDDTEFGDRSAHLRPDGSKAQYLPIHYTSLLEDPSAVSMDILSSMILYYEMAEDFNQMKKNLPTFNMILRQLGNRKLFDPKKGLIPGTQTNTYDTLEKFFEMQVFGVTKTFKEITIPGTNKKINLSKIVTKINSYVRTNNLAWNMFTTLSGYFTGTIFSRIEDFLGRYTTVKSKTWAMKEWAYNLPHITKEMGKPNKTNRLAIILLNLNLLPGHSFDNLDVNRLSKKSIDSGLYWSYEIADFHLKGQLALAAMHNFRYHEGNFYSYAEFKKAFPEEDFYSKTSIYDMLEIDDNYQMQLGDITERQWNVLKNRIENLGARIDGVLLDTDRAAAHQHYLAQLVTTHRGWLFDGIANRFKKKGFNYGVDAVEEGYYRTFWNDVMIPVFFSKERMENIKKLINEWDSLEDYQKYGIAKTLWETAFVLFLAITATLLNAIADDDDEELFVYMAYLSNRVLLEVSAFTPFMVVPTPDGIAAGTPGLFEITNTLNSPFVATKQFEAMFDIADLFSGEEIERGGYKGMPKFQKELIRLTPVLKGLNTIRSVENANQFLKNKPLRWLY